MAEHEPSIGASNDWYTPPDIFKALKLKFDLDPCSPGSDHWVPAAKVFTVHDDGLNQPWHGRVFMNPPFGGRFGHVPWLHKFFQHANGIAIVRAYTSSSWWHDEVVPHAETLLFPRGKTKFIPSQELWRKLKAESKDGVFRNAPGHGIVLIGMGAVANATLQQSGLGWFVVNKSP